MRRKRSLWQSVLRVVGDESPVMAAVGRVMLLVVLNLCLILCMMPVVTGGAAWIGLCTVLLEGKQWNYVTAVRRFFQVVRKTLTAAILPWILTLLAVGGLVSAWYIVLVQGLTNLFALMLPLLLATVVIAFTVLWLYPLMAASGMSWRQAVPAAVLLSLRELWRSLALLALEAVMAALAVWCAAEFLTLTGIWLLCGIAPIEALKLRLMAGKLPNIE